MANALVSIDFCRGQAPIHKFRNHCVPETELWHLAIPLSDNGLDLCGTSRPPMKNVCVLSFSLTEHKYSNLVNICDLG